MDDISEELQCPVCLLIPREVPIPACPAGHIVCKECRVNVTTCPTCRRPMSGDGTNTLANKMIERVPHPCKYGCQVKNYLKEIKEHEKRCTERSVKCPHLGCKEMVQVINYQQHAMSSKNCNIYPNNILLRKFTSVFYKRDYDSTTHVVVDWHMRAFQDRGKIFYFHKHFFSPEKIFAFYVTSLAEQAEKYLAKMTLKNPKDERKSLSIAQNVIPMESAPKNKKELLASKSVMLVHWCTISDFVIWRNVTENGKVSKVSNFEAFIDIL